MITVFRPTDLEQTLTALDAGLTSAQFAERVRRGEVNAAVRGGSRTYAAIVRTNLLSFFNVILFSIGVALLVMGRYSDAVVSVGLGLINALISTSQEVRAKRKLDRLHLLDRHPVVVLRDGRDAEILPQHVVRGDVIRLRAGDQVVVDGPLLDGGRVEADESLLTGESEPVVKKPADELRSGSLCVAGEGLQLARDVGAHSYAGRLTAEARRASTDRTPLQRRIEFVVRLVMVLTVLMSAAILGQAALEGFSLLRVVQITAVLSGLVPYGLFLLIAVTYTSGAAAIAAKRPPEQVIDEFERYTGLTYGTDTGFATAAATVGAQTGLETCFCLASFLLILFLYPPNRLFASWTRPTGDRRPTLLVAALVVVFAGVLFIPALSSYFNLTGPGRSRVPRRRPGAGGLVRGAERRVPAPAARPPPRPRRTPRRATGVTADPPGDVRACLPLNP